MNQRNLTFKGGVDVPHFKITDKVAITRANEPKVVYIPVHQHIGAPCDAIVQVGDKVKIGQKIAESQAFVSAPVHSSIAGTVTGIQKVNTPTGMTVNAIVIESDGSNETDDSMKKHSSIDGLSSKEILAIIKDAGITGMGGAGFPNHVKLSPPPEKTIDTVILNGAECEPFLTGDHRAMLEMPEKVIVGLKAIMKVLSVEKGYIGIEENKMDAVKAIEDALKPEDKIEVVTFKVKYPQGDEKRIIDAVTGRQVPSGGLPMDVGCVVDNIGTAVAIAEAILEGKPLYERIVTVTGKGIKEPKNLMAKIGTPFSELIEQAGGFNGKPGKVIMGGPMMGMAQFTIDVPVIKGSGGILVLTEEDAKLPEASACIRCGKCLEACPVHLQPIMISTYSLKGDFDGAEKFNAADCVECGACSFICPAKRPLTESIRVAKKEALAKRKR